MVSLVRKRRRFTTRQIETALEVLRESDIVRKWVQSQANFLGVDLNTPEGAAFLEKNSTKMARRLLK